MGARNLAPLQLAVERATWHVALFRHGECSLVISPTVILEFALGKGRSRVGISDAFPPRNMNAFRHDDAEIEENIRYAQELLERHEEELDLEDYGVDFEAHFSTRDLSDI